MGFEDGESRAFGLLDGFGGTSIEGGLAMTRFGIGAGFDVFVTSVGKQFFGFHVVLKVGLQNGHQFRVAGRVVNGNEQFDSTVEVAWHPVGAGDEQTFVTAVIEIEDAAVFEKSIDHAGDGDVFGKARDAGPEATDAAHVETNSDSCL